MRKMLLKLTITDEKIAEQIDALAAKRLASPYIQIALNRFLQSEEGKSQLAFMLGEKAPRQETNQITVTPSPEEKTEQTIVKKISVGQLF